MSGQRTNKGQASVALTKIENKKITKMKRLSLKKIAAVLTLAIAGIGLVLASIENIDKQVEVQPAEPALFWHEVDENGFIGPLQNLDASVPQTKSESMPGGSKQITDCNDATTNPCLRGYDTPQNVGDPAGTPPDANYSINRN